MIQVYEPLRCKELSFTLVESVAITLSKYVYERFDLDVEDKKAMIGYIYEDLLVIFTYLRDIGYSYANKSIGNFAYRGDYLILMNPAALRDEPELNPPNKIARMITREVILIFDYDRHKHADMLMDHLDEMSGM